jgi:hypothetical protein
VGAAPLQAVELGALPPQMQKRLFWLLGKHVDAAYCLSGAPFAWRCSLATVVATTSTLPWRVARGPSHVNYDNCHSNNLLATQILAVMLCNPRFVCATQPIHFQPVSHTVTHSIPSCHATAAPPATASKLRRRQLLSDSAPDTAAPPPTAPASSSAAAAAPCPPA